VPDQDSRTDSGVVFGELNYPHIVGISGYEQHHDKATAIRKNTDGGEDRGRLWLGDGGYAEKGLD
jgi:hypothetical protein